MYCKVCGKEISEGSAFCTGCGSPVEAITQNNITTGNAAVFASKQVDRFTQTVNEIAGGEGAVKLRFKDLFSEVFKKHDTDKADEIFICGTGTTTPETRDISTEWLKPWLFARVGVVMLIAYLLIYLCVKMFGNINAVPGVIMLGAFTVPFSILVMIFEINAPRNVSFFDTLKIFFVGGCLSLLTTMIIYQFTGSIESEYIDAIIIGIIEEAGKFIVVAFFISKTRKCRYVLNGLLIGAAVGAGFAAFESAGYAFQCLLYYGYEDMIHNIVMRSLLSPGGHVAWAAVEGAAIMLSLDGKPFEWSVLAEKRFLLLTVFCVVMHAIWDMPFSLPFYLKHITLIVVIWMIVLIMINRGLEEINGITAAEAAQ